MNTAMHGQAAWRVVRTMGQMVAACWGGALLTTPVPAQPASPDSAVVRWARANAIPIRQVDAPYVDSSFAFLRALVGPAHVLALGELVHGGHEPLAFRNEVVRYAVTHLRCTAVAIESGITESAVVDDYIQGGPGNLDSVVRRGITWEFDRLPEDRALVQWLRSYNASARTKVHFYGIDITGGNDSGAMPGAAAAVRAAVDYLRLAQPGTTVGSDVLPILDRFLPDHYGEYTSVDRDRLRNALDSVYASLERDSAAAIRRTSKRAYARGLRNAWMAMHLNAIMAAGGTNADSIGRPLAMRRDSMMAEDVRWVMRQVAPGERVLVFAHNGHVMNGGGLTVGDVQITTMGEHLRPWLGRDLVIMASTTDTVVNGTNGVGGWIGDSGAAYAAPTSFAAALAATGLPNFVLDLRTGEHDAAVAAALDRPWPLIFLAERFTIPPIVPRDAFDAVVYFARDTASKVQSRPH